MPAKKITLEVGDSFTLRDQDGNHLNVIVAESSPDDSALLMLVYLSSSRTPFRDNTTLIQPGEHPFVDRESWVRYQNVKVCSRSDIEDKIMHHYDKVSEDLLNRIQVGIETSDKVPKREKNSFLEWKMNKLFNEINKS